MNPVENKHPLSYENIVKFFRTQTPLCKQTLTTTSHPPSPLFYNNKFPDITNVNMFSLQGLGMKHYFLLQKLH